MKIWKQRKVYINYVLWRLGRRDILPNVIINQTKIREIGSPLINIINNKKFSFSERATVRGGVWVRAELVPMLERAADNLPAGYKLHFFGGWRSMVVQWTAWLRNLENKRKEFPHLPEEAVKTISRQTSASPENGFGPHQTGGAIDLTIVDKNGIELDMGTPFSDHSKRCVTKYNGVSDAAKANRRMLLRAMESADFLNYPGEWWHYSYGDRAWAAYCRKRHAIYGKVSCKDYQIKDAEQAIIKKNGVTLVAGE